MNEDLFAWVVNGGAKPGPMTNEERVGVRSIRDAVLARAEEVQTQMKETGATLAEVTAEAMRAAGWGAGERVTLDEATRTFTIWKPARFATFTDGRARIIPRGTEVSTISEEEAVLQERVADCRRRAIDAVERRDRAAFAVAEEELHQADRALLALLEANSVFLIAGKMPPAAGARFLLRMLDGSQLILPAGTTLREMSEEEEDLRERISLMERRLEDAGDRRDGYEADVASDELKALEVQLAMLISPEPCEYCGAKGTKREDPYLLEVNDESVMRALCEKCYQDRLDQR